MRVRERDREGAEEHGEGQDEPGDEGVTHAQTPFRMRSDHVEALGVNGHVVDAERDEGVFHRVHHRSGAAHEEAKPLRFGNGKRTRPPEFNLSDSNSPYRFTFSTQ